MIRNIGDVYGCIYSWACRGFDSQLGPCFGMDISQVLNYTTQAGPAMLVCSMASFVIICRLFIVILQPS